MSVNKFSVFRKMEGQERDNSKEKENVIAVPIIPMSKNNIGIDEDHKKPILEVPSPDECDDLLIYNQENYDDLHNSGLSPLIPLTCLLLLI